MSRERHRHLDALPVARDDHRPSRSHESVCSIGIRQLLELLNPNSPEIALVGGMLTVWTRGESYSRTVIESSRPKSTKGDGEFSVT